MRNTTPDSYENDQGEMPPLATYEVNEEAVALLTRWIMEMEPVSTIKPLARGSRREAFLQGRELVLPQEWTAAQVVLTDIRGRAWTLRPVGAGRFALPAGASRGLYLLKAGTLRARIQVL